MNSQQIDATQIEKTLRALNAAIGDAERGGDTAFFQRVLADDLIFRRASGAVVTKQQFLYDLEPNAFVVMRDEVVDVQVYDDSVVVTVRVTAQRPGDQTPQDYLNIRRFVNRRGEWQMQAWLNTALGQ
jgi:hypothetical protein